MRAPWIVTLVCGASGTGKSYLARPLAERYGAPLAEADDIVTALQAITTPEQQPVLHFWQTHPQFRSWARSGSPRGISRWPARFTPRMRRSSPRHGQRPGQRGAGPAGSTLRRAVVPARPWSDGLDRVDKALRET